MNNLNQSDSRLLNPVQERNICWSSIIAGVATTLLLGIMLNLLSIGVGFVSINANSNAVLSITLGTLIWLVINGTVAQFIGGWVAGWFSGSSVKKTGFLHGLIVAGLSTLLTLSLMTTTAGSILSNTFTMLGKGLSATASTIAEGSSKVGSMVNHISQLSPDMVNNMKNAIPDLNPVIEQIKNQAKELLPKINANINSDTQQNQSLKTDNDVTQPTNNNNVMDSNKIKQQLNIAVSNFIESIQDANYDDARNKLMDLLIQVTGKSKADILATLDDWQKTYTEAKDKAIQNAKEAAEKVAKAVGRFALVNFFIILLSVVAACAGGVKATSGGRRY